jgi:hypothetical protein
MLPFDITDPYCDIVVYALGHGYTETRTNTIQQSGQTPDKEVEIKNITVFQRLH